VHLQVVPGSVVCVVVYEPLVAKNTSGLSLPVTAVASTVRMPASLATTVMTSHLYSRVHKSSSTVGVEQPSRTWLELQVVLAAIVCGCPKEAAAEARVAPSLRV
jgi:hypothetical protein